jgi:trehalose-phosphatase
MSDLADAVEAMVAAESLLLMLDYDGTLVPIVSDPASAVADPSTLDLLRGLSEAPGTTVAVISGRALGDLEDFLPLETLTLIGGHGAETGAAPDLGTAETELLRRLVEKVGEIAHCVPGAMVEVKSTSVALHVRNAVHPSAGALIEAAANGPGSWEGVRCVQGKEVVDLVIGDANKGQAVDRLKARHPDALAVYVGDDVTDEDAFAALGPEDLSIKVGEGETGAGLRVVDPAAVVRLLGQVLAGRSSAGEHLVDRGEVVPKDGGAEGE